MKKITCIGAALVDLFFLSPEFSLENRQDGVFLCQKYGHKIEIEDYLLTTGGGASNTAVGFARRGHDVSIIAELGKDDFAQIVRNELIAQKVNTCKMITERQEQTGCSVILRGPDGGRTVMVSRAASAMLDDYDIPVDYLRQRDWIHLTSLGGNLNALSEIWQVFDHSTVGFSWNPGKKELELLANGSLNLPTPTNGVFFVNQEEWELVKNLQTKILATFSHVVVTAGEAGGSVYAKGKKYLDFPPAHPGPAYEATGAGDAFACAFVSTLLYDCPLDEAIEAGKNNSHSVIQFLGAKKGLLSF